MTIEDNNAGSNVPNGAGPAQSQVKVPLGAAPCEIYIRRAEDEELDRAIDVLVSATLEEREARAIVTGAPSGAGKTTLLEHALDGHPKLALAKERGAGVLRVQVPAPCTLAELGRAIAIAAGYPVKAGLRAPITWDAASRAMDVKSIRFLVLDEVQNVTETASEPEAIKIRNTFRTLLLAQGRTRGLILAGQASIIDFLSEDVQIQRRSDFVTLRPVSKSKHAAVAAGVRTISKRAGLPLCGELEANLLTDLVPRLSHAALNQFGTALDTARRPVESATQPTVVMGKLKAVPTHLTMEHFAARYASSTGNAGFANPFVARDWRTIDCTLRNVTHPSQLRRIPREKGK